MEASNSSLLRMTSSSATLTSNNINPDFNEELQLSNAYKQMFYCEYAEL